jgi:hypothetical protein
LLEKANGERVSSEENERYGAVRARRDSYLHPIDQSKQCLERLPECSGQPRRTCKETYNKKIAVPEG